jgi:cryptochrome
MSNNSVGSNNTKGDESKVGIYWYRNALRFHDNPSLFDACKDCTTLLPIYIIDPNSPFCQTPTIKTGCIRANFILESIQEVNQKLQDTFNSQLIVIVGTPQVVLPQLISLCNVTDLYYEREPALVVRESDQIVLEAIRQRQKQGTASTSSSKSKSMIRIHGYDTHTIHPMDSYLTKCKNHVAPSTYGGFTKIFQSFPRIKVEVKDITHVPPLPLKSVESIRSKFGKIGIPTLDELGYTIYETTLQNRDKGGISFLGGEQFALQLLEKQMSRSQWVITFEKPNTKPNSLSVDTTGLSPCT